MVPDSLMPNDDDDENDLSRVPVGRTPTPKRKTKKRTREMTKDDENDDTERIEKLEQLRVMANGGSIAVAETCQAIPGGVDTPADLERVRDFIAGGSVA